MLIFFVQGFLLPRLQQCQQEFLDQLGMEEKYLVYQKEAPVVDVPGYSELGVMRLWKEAVLIPEFMYFVPDYFEKPDYEIPKEFFWRVLGYLMPTYVREVVRESTKLRDDLGKMLKT
jgi:hypothetical protein